MRQVIIVGDRCIGNSTPFEASAAPQLARAAGVALLQLDFAADELVNANVLPSLGSAEVRDAVWDYFAQAAS